MTFLKKTALLMMVLTAIALTACDDSSSSNDKSSPPLSTDKAITSFVFTAADNPGVLTSDATADISGTDITAKVPPGTVVTALVATFTTTGQTIEVSGTEQTSGTTANNFTSPVTYTVTAEDSSTQTYTVTVAEQSSDKDITYFTFTATNNSGVLSSDITAQISGTDITALISPSADVTALVATFTTTGQTVEVSGTEQTSGTTDNNFTSPVTYTVTAEDSSTQTYTVTVKSMVHEAYLKAPNNSDGDWFGGSVSLYGDTLAVGASGEASNTTTIINGSDLTDPITNDDGDGNGAVYIFTRSGSTWSHQAYLKAPDNDNQDFFGWPVSLHGDTLAVGVECEDSNTTAIVNGGSVPTDDDSTNSGAVYVFSRSGTTWSLQAYLKAPNNSPSDYFGDFISLYEDTLAVSAPWEDSDTTAIVNGSTGIPTDDDSTDSGAVYIFTRTGTTWSHQAYLKAPNSDDGDTFGSSVSLYGDTIAVSSTCEDSTTTAIVNGSNLTDPITNNDGNDNGAVYVFTRISTTWSHQAYLKAPNNSNGDWFGGSVSLYGDTLAVGADDRSTTTAIVNNGGTLPTDNSGHNNGAVYIFTRNSSNEWAFQSYLKAPNNSDYNWFGDPISLYENTLAVGATGENSDTTGILYGDDLTTTNNDGTFRGAVYVFKRSGTTWSHAAYLKAPNCLDFDYFGHVSLYDGTIAVGAQGETSTTNTIINGVDLSSTNDSGNDNGAVYIFNE